MTIDEPLSKLRAAAAQCESEPTTLNGHNVCRCTREVWDFFDIQVLINPTETNLNTAQEAVLWIGKGLAAMSTIPEPADLKSASRLQQFIHSVSERLEDITVLASGGPEAFRRRTIASAMRQFSKQPTEAMEAVEV